MTDCHIARLDGTELNIRVQSNLLASELLDMVASQVALHEKQYFGLAWNDPDSGLEVWLRPTECVLDQGVPKKQGTINLHFGVRFYLKDVTAAEEFVTQRLFFLQAKALITNGQLKCPAETTITLAALALQALQGDFISESATRHHLDARKLIPDDAIIEQGSSLEAISAKVSTQYQSLTKMDKASAILSYMGFVQQLPGYGVHYFDVTNKKRLPWKLGISTSGIGVYDYRDITAARKSYQWKELLNVSFNKTKFFFEFESESQQPDGQRRNTRQGKRRMSFVKRMTENVAESQATSVWFTASQTYSQAMLDVVISVHAFVISEIGAEEAQTHKIKPKKSPRVRRSSITSPLVSVDQRGMGDGARMVSVPEDAKELRKMLALSTGSDMNASSPMPAIRVVPTMAEESAEDDDDLLERLERRRAQLATELERKRNHLEKLKKDMEDYLKINIADDDASREDLSNLSASLESLSNVGADVFASNPSSPSKGSTADRSPTSLEGSVVQPADGDAASPNASSLVALTEEAEEKVALEGEPGSGPPSVGRAGSDHSLVSTRASEGEYLTIIGVDEDAQSISSRSSSTVQSRAAMLSSVLASAQPSPAPASAPASVVESPASFASPTGGGYLGSPGSPDDADSSVGSYETVEARPLRGSLASHDSQVGSMEDSLVSSLDRALGDQFDESVEEGSHLDDAAASPPQPAGLERLLGMARGLDPGNPVSTSGSTTSFATGILAEVSDRMADFSRAGSSSTVVQQGSHTELAAASTPPAKPSPLEVSPPIRIPPPPATTPLVAVQSSSLMGASDAVAERGAPRGATRAAAPDAPILVLPDGDPDAEGPRAGTTNTSTTSTTTSTSTHLSYIAAQTDDTLDGLLDASSASLASSSAASPSVVPQGRRRHRPPSLKAKKHTRVTTFGIDNSTPVSETVEVTESDSESEDEESGRIPSPPKSKLPAPPPPARIGSALVARGRGLALSPRANRQRALRGLALSTTLDGSLAPGVLVELEALSGEEDFSDDGASWC